MTDVIAVMAKLQGDASSFNTAFSSANKAMDGMKGKASESANSAAESYEKSESRIKDSMKEIAGAIGIGFAIDKVVDWGKDTIKTMADMSASSAQTAAVIKSTGGAANVTGEQFDSLTEHLINTTGASRDQVEATNNLLLTFKGIKNGVGAGNDVFNQTAAAAQDMSRAMGISGTAAAMQLGKAMNDPAAGLAKLQRVGVTFTAQQAAQVKAMEASGNVMGAQKIILGELNSEFGGSGAAYAKSYAGSITILKNNFEEASVSVLKGFMPAIAGVASVAGKAFGWLSESKGVEDFGKNISSAFSQAWQVIEPVAKGLGGIVGPALGTLAKSVLPIVSAFSPLQIIFKAITPVLGVIGALVANLAGALSGALGSVLPVVTSLSNTFAGILSGILAKVLPVIVTLVGSLSGVLDEIMPTIAQVAGTFGGILASAMKDAGGLIEAILPLFGGLVKALMPIIPPILAVVSALLPLIANLLTSSDIIPVFTSLVQAIIPVVLQVVSALAGAFGPILVALMPLITTIGKLFAMLVPVLLPLVKPILDLALAFTPLIVLLAQLIAAILPPVIKLLTSLLVPILGLISPLLKLLVPALTVLVTVLASVITWVVKVIAAVASWIVSSQGAAKTLNAVFSAIGGFIGSAISKVRSVIGGIGSFISGQFNTVVSAVQRVGSIFSSVFGQIGGFVSRGFSSAIGIARSSINGIIGVVNSAITALDSVHVTLPKALGGASIGINIPHIPGLATGGTIQKAGLAVVGENGPELVSLPTGAAVTPAYPSAQALQGMAGQQGPSVTFENHFEIAATDPAEIAKETASVQKHQMEAAGVFA